MALYHRATITPTKAEVVERWAPTQSWYPADGGAFEVIGAFRFDDPAGRVGMETHLVDVGGQVLHVPLTYRDEPLDAAADAFICEMEHSELGTRWVYDGLGDPTLLVMLAAVAMTGQGEALGMVVYDGRWFIAPTNVRIEGGTWGAERVAVDEMRRVAGTDASPVFANERFEMTVHRRPEARTRPNMGLSASWEAQPAPVLLAEVRERPR